MGFESLVFPYADYGSASDTHRPFVIEGPGKSYKMRDLTNTLSWFPCQYNQYNYSEYSENDLNVLYGTYGYGNPPSIGSGKRLWEIQDTVANVTKTFELTSFHNIEPNSSSDPYSATNVWNLKGFGLVRVCGSLNFTGNVHVFMNGRCSAGGCAPAGPDGTHIQSATFEILQGSQIVKTATPMAISANLEHRFFSFTLPIAGTYTIKFTFTDTNGNSQYKTRDFTVASSTACDCGVLPSSIVQTDKDLGVLTYGGNTTVQLPAPTLLNCTFQKWKVTALPLGGTLKVNGVAVAVGASILATDIVVWEEMTGPPDTELSFELVAVGSCGTSAPFKIFGKLKVKKPNAPAILSIDTCKNEIKLQALIAPTVPVPDGSIVSLYRKPTMELVGVGYTVAGQVTIKPQPAILPNENYTSKILIKL